MGFNRSQNELFRVSVECLRTARNQVPRCAWILVAAVNKVVPSLMKVWGQSFDEKRLTKGARRQHILKDWTFLPDKGCRQAVPQKR